MAELYQLRYGMKVRVKQGKDKGSEGWVSMGSRLGDVGINEEPKLGYQIRAEPSRLEILSREIHPLLRDPLNENGVDYFWGVRTQLCINNPDLVIANKEYFEEGEVTLAASLRRRKENP